MPVFGYRAYRADGRSVKSTIEALSRHDAVQRLKEEGLFIRQIREEKPGRIQRFRYFDKSALAGITRQLSILLGSGVPIADALQSLAGQMKGLWRQILVELKERVIQGTALSKALEDHGSIFPGFYTAMIAAGEASGRVDEVLSNLADYLEGQHGLRAKFTASLVYPLFMVAISFIVVSFLFAFVIPKLRVIFEAGETSLPMITRILLWTSAFFQKYWWLLLGTCFISYFPGKRVISKKRQSIEKFLLNLPGGLFQSLYYSRFARTFSFLLLGGVPHLKALRLSACAVGNSYLEGKILEAERLVSEGAALSTSLHGFPQTFLQLVSTGEKTGKLAVILKKAADGYEADFLVKMQRFVALIEPTFVIIMGLIVGFIVFAILLPIFQLNQLIK